VLDVGGAPHPVDVRLLAATNKDLEAEIAKGTFREDLFYRIKVIHIHMPPLREIREDIALLANHFLEEYCRETGREPMTLHPQVIRKLLVAPWPGNVRELRNEVMRLAACARDHHRGRSLGRRPDDGLTVRLLRPAARDARFRPASLKAVRIWDGT
jgi:DNA-binding NtrC family response regulator